MIMEVVIEGNAFISGELIKCCIGIENGKISSIKKILKGTTHYDFGDKLILPSGIDAHVHVRDPGFTYKEDFTTGSACAAYGGISCILDMPNTKPPAITKEVLQDKRRIAESKSHIDFGLLAGVSESADIKELSKFSTAFKIYLASTTGEMQIKDYNVLNRILTEIKDTEKTTCIHCEDDTKLNKSLKPRSLKEHLAARPNIAEASAIEMVGKNHNEAKVHICHVSTKEGADLVSKYPFTSEVTPHHLFLNSDSKIGPKGKVNPPLREVEDQDALWNALRKGTIDILASDHAPHTLEEKENFEKAPSGMPGVETMFPIMLSRVKHNKFELNRLVNAQCERPAEIFGINKGRLEPGYDADIIMVDMRAENKIKGENLHSKCDWTAFEGFSAVFPKYTFLRGEIVIEDWELTGDLGLGCMVP
jgi:dihydroorotase